MAEGLDSERSEIHIIGLEIGSSLLGYYVELVRLSLLGEEILPENGPEKEAKGNSESFYEMFDRLLKKASPSKIASIIYSVLQKCCCNDANVSKLKSYVEPDFDLQSYPNIVLKLRIAEFLCNLGEENCLLAMMVYSYLHMGNMAIDRCTPLQYIHVLFQHEVAERDKLEKLAEWFNKKGYFKDPPEGICND